MFDELQDGPSKFANSPAALVDRKLDSTAYSLAPVPAEAGIEQMDAERRRRLETSKQRVPALRLGDARVLALLQAVCHSAHLPNGFRHRDLRPMVASLVGRELTAYSAGAMTYDLRRMRLQGVIERVPRPFRYVVTPMARGSLSVLVASISTCCTPTGLIRSYPPTNSRTAASCAHPPRYCPVQAPRRCPRPAP